METALRRDLIGSLQNVYHLEAFAALAELLQGGVPGTYRPALSPGGRGASSDLSRSCISPAPGSPPP